MSNKKDNNKVRTTVIFDEKNFKYVKNRAFNEDKNRSDIINELIQEKIKENN